MIMEEDDSYDDGGSVRGVWADGVREKYGDDAHAPRQPARVCSIAQINAYVYT